MAEINLSKAVRSNLLSLQNTATMMAKTQERLATGLKVNSALDNPTNFFTASSLKSRASDLGLLMDSVSNAVQTLAAADKGIKAITKLVESAQATARQALQTSATISEPGVATSATVTAGAFSAVDVSGAFQAGQAAEVSGTGFSSVDLSNAPTSAELTGSNFADVDVSTGSVTFDLSVDGGSAVTITIDSAAVAAYNSAHSTSLDENALTAQDVADMINDQFGSTVATVDNGELVLSSGTSGSGSSIEISNYADTANGGLVGLADGTDAGVAGDSITFDLAVNGGSAQTITIDAAVVAAYNAANSTTLDASALGAQDIADLINDQAGATVASVDGGELVLSASSSSSAPTVAITNYSATVSGGSTGLADGSDTGTADTPADAISFSISINGGSATNVTIDAAAVTAYNTANGTTFDAGALTAENIAALINDQVGSNVASVTTGGALQFASTTTGTTSNVTITGYTADVSGGSTGIANANQSGTAAGAATEVANPKRAELVEQYNELLSQINDLAKDASFNGVNLLNGDELQVIFNEDGSSKLDISGVTFDATGLGLAELDADAFDSNTAINEILGTLKSGVETLRTQASKFGSNLSVVETRQNFTKDMINVLETGAANLTLADTNEEAANLLALQTRQQLSSTALSMASQADQAVLRLF
ncbi:flagellin [Pelagibacterium limicola]|uniref:flagellin N-terminal helical domain-containing protein n=1 Tax=Pelagibacterium limicola TaxID=2791022 RepID=UPI0018AFB973|nr:flagellin [Pelagibacterium limicola]